MGFKEDLYNAVEKELNEEIQSKKLKDKLAKRVSDIARTLLEKELAQEIAKAGNSGRKLYKLGEKAERNRLVKEYGHFHDATNCEGGVTLAQTIALQKED